MKQYEMVEYSRAMKDYRLKTKVTKDMVPFKKDILSKIVNNVMINARIPVDLSRYKRKPVPKTFHGVEKPNKDDLKKRRISRMGK